MVTAQKMVEDLFEGEEGQTFSLEQLTALMIDYAEYCLRQVKLLVNSEVDPRNGYELFLFEIGGKIIITNRDQIIQQIKKQIPPLQL